MNFQVQKNCVHTLTHTTQSDLDLKRYPKQGNNILLLRKASVCMSNDEAYICRLRGYYIAPGEKGD